MKKYLALLVVFVALLLVAPGTWAYTINDPVGDRIGNRVFESYGINILNFTPGYNSGPIAFELYTNYPQSGYLVGSWQTYPADLFIRETYYGNDYWWAIPLVDHEGFNAGTMYAVGSWYISDDFEPAGGGYSYNHNIPVWIKTVGSNYGYSSFPGGTVTWNSIGTDPDYRIDVTTIIYEDDPNGRFYVLWGTSTCANDVVVTPIPGSLLLLSSGLVGLVALGRRRLQGLI